MEEFELINKLKNGDEEAFSLLIDRYEKLILKNCYRFVNDKETSRDLTQDVFLEIYRSVNFFRAESKLSTWIYQISVRKSLDYLKSQKRSKRFAILKSIFESDEMTESIQDPESLNPEEYLENQERVKILSWALGKLPENQRVAFTLSKNEQLEAGEVAAIMSLSVSSVNSLIHRAKANLRKILYNYYKKHI